VTDDLHSPITAAPTPVVTSAEAGPGRPAGSAAAGAEDASGAQQAVASAQQAVAGAQQAVQGAAADKPEMLVGAAFAGGFVFAFLLKRIARD
jgi:hypothetical protein